LLTAIGLPVSYPQERWPALLDAMRIDKKARGKRLRFVALSGLAKPFLLEDPDPGLLTAAYSELNP
jgi:3-dehydroquinate synthase